MIATQVLVLSGAELDCYTGESLLASPDTGKRALPTHGDRQGAWALPGPGFDPTPSACEEFCFLTSHTKYGETIKSMGQDSNRQAVESQGDAATYLPRPLG